MHTVYMMAFAAALTLGLGGTFDAAYDAYRQHGASAAVATFVSNTVAIIDAQDHTRVPR